MNVSSVTRENTPSSFHRVSLATGLTEQMMNEYADQQATGLTEMMMIMMIMRTSYLLDFIEQMMVITSQLSTRLLRVNDDNDDNADQQATGLKEYMMIIMRTYISEVRSCKCTILVLNKATSGGLDASDRKSAITSCRNRNIFPIPEYRLHIGFTPRVLWGNRI